MKGGFYSWWRGVVWMYCCVAGVNHFFFWSKAGGQRSKQASNKSSKPTNLPGRQPASQPARSASQGNQPACQRARKRANKQSINEASKRTSKSASQQASQRLSTQASKQGSEGASKPANKRGYQKSRKTPGELPMSVFVQPSNMDHTKRNLFHRIADSCFITRNSYLTAVLQITKKGGLITTLL